MRENFLHHVWLYKKFETTNLKTVNEEILTLVSVGQQNFNSGPDFFNAQIKIGKQLWAGNVEIHIKSSDWYAHHHETDANYDNVILHVVWEHDAEIFRKDNTTIPTLELKHIVNSNVLLNYQRLFSKTQKWINCEHDFASVDEFIVDHWLERLYFERLEQKSELIDTLLKQSSNNWEAVFFKMLAKNFGLKVNGDAFLSVANSFDFSIVRKVQSKVLNIEALFFGQAGLLEDDIQESYYLELKEAYAFLKQKHQLLNNNRIAIQFFRLRPPNFPTIRLSQLANVYCQHQSLFAKIISAKTIEDMYALFSVSTTSFWESHYTFGKVSKSFKKIISKSFIDLLIINTIIPIKFSYAKHQGKFIDEELVVLIQKIPSEKNSIVNKFNTLKQIYSTALQSQAILQLKTAYCDKNRCLKCAIGNSLLNQ